MEKAWGGGGENKIPPFFHVVVNIQNVEQQRVDPSLPQRYKSRPGKADQLAGSVSKKLDCFASVNPMLPGSVIVCGVEFGDHVAHTDTSTAPHVLPATVQSKSDYHLSTFVAVSPH